MADEITAPASAEPEKVETAGDESLIDNRRSEVEKQVAASNDNPQLTEVPEELTEPKEVPKKIEEEPDQLDSIKKSVQKRINKVVAQKKSVEDELAEAKAELERLKASPKIEQPQDDKPPTPEQVEAYILKMREEGNAKEEIAATRFLIKLEKELAVKSIKEEQEKAQLEANAKAAKQLTDWANLQSDYVMYDESGKPDVKHDLNLSNQSGLLYKTALSLYQDKELHADFYADPDTIQGFRRAVSDAYREIHQQGLITPKGESAKAGKRIPLTLLAEPEAESTEEPSQSTSAASLSDAEKVREEIRNRKKNRFIRKPSRT